MKHKVGELDGALLDAAVAMVDGVKLVDRLLPSGGWREAYSSAGTFRDTYSPSTSWTLAGPIIERERIELQRHASSDGWWAGVRQPPEVSKAGGVCMTGPTALIAAMRAYVASKLGEDVELPQSPQPDPNQRQPGEG